MHLYGAPLVRSESGLSIKTSNTEIDDNLAHLQGIARLCKSGLGTFCSLCEQIDNTGEERIVFAINSMSRGCDKCFCEEVRVSPLGVCASYCYQSSKAILGQLSQL